MPKKRRPASHQGASHPKPLRLEYPADLTRNLARAFQSAEDRLDSLQSEASLADGKPIPAAQAWRRFGL